MKRHKGNSIIFTLKVLRRMLKVGFALLDMLMAFAFEKRQPRYTALHAHELHKDDSISDQEYMRSYHGRD